MLQQSLSSQSLFFLLFVFLSCLSSSALLLPATRGTTTGNHDDVCGNCVSILLETSGRRGKNKHHATSLWKMPKKRNIDCLEDEVITPATVTTIISESLTRQLFLSSVYSRFVSIIAVIAGVNIPRSAIATESNNFDSNDDRILTAAQPATSSRASARVLSMTLRSLPVSGCWAATVTVSQNLDNDNGNINDDDFYTYLAVVDTGSPFLTAPAGAFRQTKKIVTTTFVEKENKQTKQSLFTHLSIIFRHVNKSDSDVSYEQYGKTVGSVQWRMAPYLTLIGNGNVENVRNAIEYSRDKSKSIAGHRHPVAGGDDTEIEPVIIQDQTDFVLGIPSEEVVVETGGIFLGLMTVDAARPTPLQQLGYDAFAMQFRNNSSDRPNNRNGRIEKKKEITNDIGPATLILWNGKQSDTRNEKNAAMTPSLIQRLDPYSMRLFDLTPYGPNLHHYGVLCDRFECRWGGDDDFDAVAFDCDLESGINSCTSASASLLGVSLSRPLVAVFDTGLSGCIFSDTLWEEIQLERRRLKQSRNNRRQRWRGSVRSKDGLVDTNDENHSNNSNDDMGLSGSNSEEMPPIGCTVWLPTIGSVHTTYNVRYPSEASSSPPSVLKISSISKYWRFQSFRLPWWYANNDIAKDDDTKKYSSDATSKNTNNKYPHVVVLGSTFWRNPNVLELAVDTRSERAKITTVAQS